jgi:hypothetical protein
MKVIGFLWETFPLPPEKLLLRKFEVRSVFEKYKNSFAFLNIP